MAKFSDWLMSIVGGRAAPSTVSPVLEPPTPMPQAAFESKTLEEMEGIKQSRHISESERVAIDAKRQIKTARHIETMFDPPVETEASRKEAAAKAEIEAKSAKNAEKAAAWREHGAKGRPPEEENGHKPSTSDLREMAAGFKRAAARPEKTDEELERSRGSGRSM